MYAARTGIVGWWEPPSRVPEYFFFLFFLLGANEDGEEEGGQGAGTVRRKHLVDGKKNDRNKERGMY